MSSEGNIVRFPARKLHEYARSVAYQLELFDESEVLSNRISFVNPEEFQQDQFLKLLARNRFNILIDYRPRPVFRRPKFSHREVTSHLHQRNIAYVELARYAQRANSKYADLNDILRREYANVFQSGPIFCLGLFDDEALKSGIIDAFRAGIAARNSIIEVHPNSLLR